jgi:hypothetical protein
VPVGPTPEIVNRVLDRLEAMLDLEMDSRPNEFDEGPITHLVGSLYLSAIHSQLTLDDPWLLRRRDELRPEFPFVPWLLRRRDELRPEFPFVTGDEPGVIIPSEMASRFVVAEVLNGEIDRLRALSWRIIGALVEESINIAEREPGRLPQAGDDDYLWRFHKLSQERLNPFWENELPSDYRKYVWLIRQAFLEWLRAFRGVHIEALGEFTYVWLSNRRELRQKYRSDGEPYVRGDEEPW